MDERETGGRIEANTRTDSQSDAKTLGPRRHEEEAESSETLLNLKRNEIPDIDLFNFEDIGSEVEPKKQSSSQPKKSKTTHDEKIAELANRIQFVVNKGIGMVGMIKPELAVPIAPSMPSILDVVAVNNEEAIALAEFQQAWFPVKKLTKKQKEKLEKFSALLGVGMVVGAKIYAINQILAYQKELLKREAA